MSSKVVGRIGKLKGPGGIIREFHHLKLIDQDETDPTQLNKPRFERAMMLYRPELKGRSTYIPGNCAWKYLDPKDNEDVHDQDVENFSDVCKALASNMKLNPFGNFLLEMRSIRMCNLLHHRSKLMYMTSYFLCNTIQLMEVELNEKNVYRLLSYVQDGLRDLQTMALPLPEETVDVGEVTYTLYRNDEPIVREAPLTIKQGELKTGVIH